jgi:hypothetical protein
LEQNFHYLFFFSSLFNAGSKQCHLMVDYVTKHGQHEYIEFWSNGARFTPGLGVGRFQKNRGQQRVNPLLPRGFSV